MKQTLFVSDLDGTLLNNSSKVSHESVSMLNQAIAQGALFTVATARTPATVEPLLRKVHMQLPTVVMTGAALYDTACHFYVETSYMAEPVADRAEAIMRAAGLAPFRYTMGTDMVLDTYYKGGTPSAQEQKFISQRCNLPLKRMHVNERNVPVPQVGSTVMFFAMGPSGAVAAAAEQLRRESVYSVSCYGDSGYPGCSLLEVFLAGVSKADTVERLRSQFGRECSLTVFGDNLNDLPMMGVADTAVAVANAVPEVLEAADVVIGPNTDDSVARYILEQSAQNVEAARRG